MGISHNWVSRDPSSRRVLDWSNATWSLERDSTREFLKAISLGSPHTVDRREACSKALTYREKKRQYII